MNESRYRFLLWQLIAAADSGDHDEHTVDEVHAAATAERSEVFLKKTFPNFDFSLMDAADWKDLNETWGRIANAVDYGRKFGVERKGLALLMAYTLESMQMQLARQGNE